MSNPPDWEDDKGMYAWLTAKLDDQLVKGAGAAEVVDPPDFVEEGGAGNGVAAFAVENGENFQFARRQFDRFAAAFPA